MKLADLVRLGRTPKAEAAPPPSQAVDDINAAIGDIDLQRATMQQKINGLSLRRRELLRDGAADEAIRALDQDLADLRLGLERFDAIETALLERLREVAGQAAEVDVSDLAARFAVTIERFADVLRDAAAIRGEMLDLRAEAASRGLETAFGYLEVPNAGIGTTFDAAEQYRAGALQRLSGWKPAPIADRPHAVRFIQAHDVYRLGEQAGFGAAHAHALVAAGVAEFVSTRRAAPEPELRRIA